MQIEPITVVIRDLYMNGTETIMLEGKMVEKFYMAVDTSKFLAELETVSFTNPYVVSVTKS